MAKYLTPKGFLLYGGVILLVLGIGGYVLQIIFPPQGMFIGDVLYLDSFENIAHTVLGIVALAAYYALSADLQKWLVALVGAFGIVVAILGVLASAHSSRSAKAQRSPGSISAPWGMTFPY